MLKELLTTLCDYMGEQLKKALPRRAQRLVAPARCSVDLWVSDTDATAARVNLAACAEERARAGRRREAAATTASTTTGGAPALAHWWKGKVVAQRPRMHQ